MSMSAISTVTKCVYKDVFSYRSAQTKYFSHITVLIQKDTRAAFSPLSQESLRCVHICMFVLWCNDCTGEACVLMGLSDGRGHHD